MVADLRWSEEQQELASMMSGLLAKHSDSGAVRAAAASSCGYDEKLWRLLCEQVGVAALAVPEEHGGAGFGFLEIAVVLEQLGNALSPSPLLSTLVATEALRRSADATACERLLPSLAAGTVATLAWTGPSSLPDASQTVTADDELLTGTVPLVLDGDTAEILLVAAQTPDGVGLFEVPVDADRLSRTRTPAMDLTLPLATVQLERVPATRIGGDVTEALQQVHAVACAAVANLQVGTAQRALDMTVAYSKERVQFGRPIGSFQALKHRMADLLVLLETARSAAMDAAFAVADDDDTLVRRTSVAKAWCSGALTRIASETVQIHGGIAITWEHDAHLVLKRAHALSHLFGAPHLHRRVVASLPA
jgi:alkylation response protein AidB-like acyl-CoA dehydrogenase